MDKNKQILIAIVAVVVIVAAVAAGVLLTKKSDTPSHEKVINDYPTADVFDGFEGTVTCNVTEAKSVSKDVFDKMNDKDTLIVNITPASNGTTTTWTFSGADKQQGATKDVDLKLSTSIESGVSKFNFADNGTLPAKASVKVCIGTEVKDTLYDIVYDGGAHESVGAAKVDSAGYIEFKISHCSSYIGYPSCYITLKAGNGCSSITNAGDNLVHIGSLYQVDKTQKTLTVTDNIFGSKKVYTAVAQSDAKEFVGFLGSDLGYRYKGYITGDPSLSAVFTTGDQVCITVYVSQLNGTINGHTGTFYGIASPIDKFTVTGNVLKINDQTFTAKSADEEHMAFNGFYDWGYENVLPSSGTIGDYAEYGLTISPMFDNQGYYKMGFSFGSNCATITGTDPDGEWPYDSDDGIWFREGCKIVLDGEELKITDGNDKLLYTFSSTASKTGMTFNGWGVEAGKIGKNFVVSPSYTAEGEKEYSFYFCDNFTYDGFYTERPFPVYPATTNLGVWVRGTTTTDSVEEAFRDACKTFYGSDVAVTITDDGKVTQVGDVVDGNLYFQAWDSTSNKWVSKVFTDDLSPYEDFALVHGACEKDTGAAPYPRAVGYDGGKQNVLDPADRTWYYGDTAQHKSGSKILFYVYDNFEYTEFTSEREDCSDPLTLLVPGIWVAGYAGSGEQAGEALKNALDMLGYEYDSDGIDGGFIGYINGDPEIYDANFAQTSWDEEYEEQETHWNQNWYLTQVTVDLPELMYDICGEKCVIMTIGHGEWGGPTGFDYPPLATWMAPDKCTWYY